MVTLEKLHNVIYSSEEKNPFEIPYILDLIHRVRGTFQTDAPLNTKDGRDYFIGWWMCFGLPEYNFSHHFISKKNIDHLNEIIIEDGKKFKNKYKFFYKLITQSTHIDNTPHDNDPRKLEIWYYLMVVPHFNLFWLEGDEEIAKLTAKNSEGISELDQMIIDFYKLFEGDNSDEATLLNKGKELFNLENYFSMEYNRFNGLTPKNINSLEEGFNIVGLIGCHSGVGEDSRMAAACLETIDQKYKFASLQNIANEELPYDTNLFCLTGFQTIIALASGGEEVFQNRYNIGYFPWELPEWPKDLIPALDIVDEIWVASEFIKNSITPFTNKKVTIIPLAVVIPKYKERPKSYFNIPEDTYTFLYTFDFISGFERKNVLNTLRYFRDAFDKGDEKVSFFLKSRNYNSSIPGVKEITDIIENDPRIIHCQDDITREELTSLTAACDSFLSIHRAEGFGRCIAEAIILGCHVITTRYSGNLVFCNDDNCTLINYKLIPVNTTEYVFSKDQTWAEPNREETIRALIDAYTKSISYSQPSSFHKEIKKFLSPEEIGNRFLTQIKFFRCKKKKAL